MTVAQLIKKLQKFDQDRIVVMSSDPEGNGYSKLRDINGDYNYNDGEIGLEELTKEYEDAGYGEEDIMEGGTPCVIFWP